MVIKVGGHEVTIGSGPVMWMEIGNEAILMADRHEFIQLATRMLAIACVAPAESVVIGNLEFRQNGSRVEVIDNRNTECAVSLKLDLAQYARLMAFLTCIIKDALKEQQNEAD